MFSQTLGGIGLFLVGMVLATDGLKSAAGDALRRVLLRFTGGRIKALLSGAVATALVQSSSATTVATIGFVGAGLLTFKQSIGVIFGANLGTTATGWIVALVGLKFSVSTIALPLVGVGALMRLFLSGRARHLGLALAGFGILFVGLDVLQAGMKGVADVITPESLPNDTFLGRLGLVGIGAFMTAVMQSSSAAAATTLTALHSGTISSAQAAAMMIGANIGTTVTAGIAAVGASLAAKRTALAHLAFNVLTGATAFLMLPLFLALTERVGDGDAAVSIAAFHTVFNLVGVAMLLPFTDRLARFIKRVAKDHGPPLTRHLDARIASLGPIAVEAVRRTSIDIAGAVFSTLEQTLRSGVLSDDGHRSLDAVAEALGKAQRFVERMKGAELTSEEEVKRQVSTLHALEHLERLVQATAEGPDRGLRDFQETREGADALADGMHRLAGWAGDAASAAPIESIRHLAEETKAHRREARQELFRRIAQGHLSPDNASRQVESMRWLEEVGYAAWRVLDHLHGERVITPGPVSEDDDANGEGDDDAAEEHAAEATDEAGETGDVDEASEAGDAVEEDGVASSDVPSAP
jgi:phosphate:Na+ symporter